MVEKVVTNCDHLQNLKFSPVNPHAFTEHGAIMREDIVRGPRSKGLLILVQVNYES